MWPGDHGDWVKCGRHRKAGGKTDPLVRGMLGTRAPREASVNFTDREKIRRHLMVIVTSYTALRTANTAPSHGTRQPETNSLPLLQVTQELELRASLYKSSERKKSSPRTIDFTVLGTSKVQ